MIPGAFHPLDTEAGRISGLIEAAEIVRANSDDEHLRRLILERAQESVKETKNALAASRRERQLARG